MTEPIFSLNECQDSLDIMLEMEMYDLLKHPIVIEVLNLVNDGKYSIDSSLLSMSQTLDCLNSTKICSHNSVFDRIIENITTFGTKSNKKQISLQMHIWKNCIKQREMD